jgi:hypothetical protein
MGTPQKKHLGLFTLQPANFSLHLEHINPLHLKGFEQTTQTLGTIQDKIPSSRSDNLDMAIDGKGKGEQVKTVLCLR